MHLFDYGSRQALLVLCNIFIKHLILKKKTNKTLLANLPNKNRSNGWPDVVHPLSDILCF